jgi:dTMP kinase
MSGIFITFEGGDGSGKSTQARRLADRLTDAGYPTLTTREPGGTRLGAAVRAVLLHPEASLTALTDAELVTTFGPVEIMLPLTEALLLSADRAQHVAQIRSWLESGATVISDRYADATLAYQGYGRGYDLDTLRTLERMATGGLRPHLTLLLDLDVAEGQRRKQAGHASGEELNRLDTETLAFHQRVRDGYLTLAREEPARWVLLDAGAAPDALAAQVWAAVSARMNLGETQR